MIVLSGSKHCVEDVDKKTITSTIIVSSLLLNQTSDGLIYLLPVTLAGIWGSNEIPPWRIVSCQPDDGTTAASGLIHIYITHQAVQ